MNKLVVNGVRLDKLLSLEPGTVIDAVPEDSRSDFTYWRGLHLGRLVLNLLRGRFYLNAGETDMTIFWGMDPFHAYNRARDEANPDGTIARTQWKPEVHAAMFKELVGVPAPRYFAGAVVASVYEEPPTLAEFGRWGVTYNVPFKFTMVDPYSVAAFEDLFECNLRPEGVAGY